MLNGRSSLFFIVNTSISKGIKEVTAHQSLPRHLTSSLSSTALLSGALSMLVITTIDP